MPIAAPPSVCGDKNNLRTFLEVIIIAKKSTSIGTVRKMITDKQTKTQT